MNVSDNPSLIPTNQHTALSSQIPFVITVPKSRRDKIGELAEKELDRWASQAGITINPSKEDRKGWDYILEFRLNESEADVPQNTPLDKDLREVKAFIQVKGSDDNDRSEDISLTNWRSLIGTTHPVYILRVEFDGKDEPQRAYLRHIDQDTVREVLKRLRKVSASDPKEDTPLHKRTRRINFDESDRLPSLNGAGLRSMITEPLNGKPRSYEAKKRKWIDELGYDESNAKVETTIRIPEEYRDDPSDFWVDFAAGLVPELDVVKGQIYDSRFGIPMPQKSIGEGKLIPEKRFTEAVLTFATVGKRFERIRFPVRVQKSSLPADELSTDRFKIQMYGPGLRILVTSEQGQIRKFDFKLDPYRAESLSALEKTARLVHHLSETIQNGTQTKLSFTHDGEGGNLGVFSPADLDKTSVDLPTQLREARDLIQRAITVARESDIPMNAEVQLVQLERQKTGLIALGGLIRGDKSSTFKLVVTTEQVPKAEDRITVPVPIVASFGEWFALAVVVLIGSLEYNKEEDHGNSYKPTLVTDDASLPLIVSTHTDENNPDSAEVVEIALQRLERNLDNLPKVKLLPGDKWVVMDPFQE
jgi:hypothetical protein